MSEPPASPDNRKSTLLIIRGIIREYIHSALHLSVLLVSAGTAGWVNAWLVFGLSVTYQTVNAAVLSKVNPSLLSARGQVIHSDTKLFDKMFVVLYMPLSLGVSVISGLDAVRYHWSDVPLWVNILGVVLYVSSTAFGTWSMAVNRFFEGTVRIQQDRGHQVCTSGPYRIIRHPGYAAAIIGSVAYPLILGSLWGLITVSLVVILFVVRTALEDRTLRRELSGYAEYAREVRYRLLPYIW